MKVIIAGSRTVRDYNIIERAIQNSKFNITEVISGNAKGADALGELYAFNNNIPVKRFPANWNRYGKKAGYVRNTEMAEYADGLVAIWDGISNGTKHMISHKESHNLNTYVHKFLECSSKGEKQLSAFYAKVKFFGKSDSIENHYQLSKVVNGAKPKSWKDVKGNVPDAFVVNDVVYAKELLSQWYKLLWIKYLDNNPDLVSYASQFDDYNDMFRSNKTINCQADVIYQYIKEGRKSVIDDCHELISFMRSKNNH